MAVHTTLGKDSLHLMDAICGELNYYHRNFVNGNLQSCSEQVYPSLLLIALALRVDLWLAQDVPV